MAGIVRALALAGCIEPSDGIDSTVHGTMTAHLAARPGAQYSGMADVDMTF